MRVGLEEDLDQMLMGRSPNADGVVMVGGGVLWLHMVF